MGEGDYLWDRSGSDPDVEALEAKLGELRYRPPAQEEKPARSERTRLPSPPKRSWRDRRPPSIAVAVLLGVLAAVAAWSGIARKEADVRRGWNLVPVVVASQEIPEGTVVTFDMISQRSVPEQFVTSSVVKPESASYIVNQKVLAAVQAGDPLLWSQFEGTRAAERLSMKVHRKTRALTIETSPTASVGGWVRPNDHVDVIGTFRDPQTNESVAVTLLQNVLVLATGKITGTTNVNLLPETQRDYGNVSLLVLPEEAEALVLATEVGALTLALRNPDDLDVVEDRGRATMQTLLSGERTRVLQARRREVISVIRGAASSGAGAAQ